jgi:hypothetical protein
MIIKILFQIFIIKKSKKELKLFLTLIDGKIETDNIHFLPLKDFETGESELIIALGVKNLDDLGDFYEKNFKLFFQKPILNIDNQPANQEFGKINLIEEDRPYSWLAATLIKSIGEIVIDRVIATNLFLGILDFYKGKKVDNKIMELLVYLRHKGANIKKIVESLLKDVSDTQKDLIELTFKKMDYDKNLNLPIVVFEKKGPQELRVSDKDLLIPINALRGDLLFCPSFLLLWEIHSSDSFVRGVFYSPDQDKIKKLSKNLKGKTKENTVLFSTQKKSLNSVKQEILNLLES